MSSVRLNGMWSLKENPYQQNQKTWILSPASHLTNEEPEIAVNEHRLLNMRQPVRLSAKDCGVFKWNA